VRIEGVENIRAVRASVPVPIVGIIKRIHPGFAPYITSTLDEVRAVAEAGADIVAFDATLRPRVDGAVPGDFVDAARQLGLISMADCATAGEGGAAAAAGADIVATTLAGYTDESAGRALPALDVVSALAAMHPFVICEGGIAEPGQARAAFAAGAAAVVVGTAITNVDALTRRFAQAVPRAASDQARRT
jgi:N-acylglucosamine-6-phosphate 2-epimerase